MHRILGGTSADPTPSSEYYTNAGAHGAGASTSDNSQTQVPLHTMGDHSGHHAHAGDQQATGKDQSEENNTINERGGNGSVEGVSEAQIGWLRMAREMAAT